MIIVENKSRRGRPLAFDRHLALERAMRVFWAHGYEAASMPMLTVAMGISAQSLYAAFGSKEALYREAIRLYRETIGGFAARALDEETNALDAVQRLVADAAVTFAQTAGAPGCMITTAPSGAENEPLTVFGRELRAESIARVAERIERGRRDGQVRSDVDSGAWARLIGTIVQGMSVQARDGASADSLRATAAVAAEALEVLRPADSLTRR
jgi:AcrR family transcriptional regulator